MTFLYIVIANLVVSLISLAGVVLLLRKNIKASFTHRIIAFSSGTMLGGAFIHLLPESVEEFTPSTVFYTVLITLLIYLLLEKILHWHHCGEHTLDEECISGHKHTSKAVGKLSLIGDGIHNFIDGLIIAASFLISPALGVSTTIAVAIHEIPQEIADLGILLHAGYSKGRALFYNLLIGGTAIVGGVVGWVIGNNSENFIAFLLPIAAAGFLYISLSDLLPEIRREKSLYRFMQSFLLVGLGIGVMWLLTFLE